MKIIGLTGKACTGKNMVAGEFEKRGFLVIDVDKLGHQALEENKDEIVKAFKNVLKEDSTVDRKMLGNIVFSSKKRLKELEAITHPGIKNIICKIISDEKQAKGRNIIINAALLERGKLDVLCDSFIYVKSSFLVRYKRTKKRDNRNFIWFFKRNLAQRHIKVTQKMKEKNVFFITNNKGIGEICRQVSNICDIL